MSLAKRPRNKGSFCLKGKKLEGDQLTKLLKHNAELAERYRGDPVYRAKFKKEEICANCGKVAVKKKGPTSGFCNEKCYWEYIEKTDPVLWKARSLSANIVFGGNGGKLAWMRELIAATLTKPCKYCGVKLTLDNVSLDHKIAVGKTKYRLDKRQYARERWLFDSCSNLHLICSKCNRIKGNMNDDEFESLLNFLSLNKVLRNKVLNRLSAGQIWVYGKR